jgi:type IV secretory pathway component VirB8
MQLMIASSHTPRAGELSKMYANEAMIEDAARWLTEQADRKANHERRMTFVAWLILVFAVVGVILVAIGEWPLLKGLFLCLSSWVSSLVQFR